MYIFANRTCPRVLESLGDKAFYDCSAPIAVDLSNTEITKIVGKSFYNCTALKTLKFPNTLENLNNQDFANCSLLNQHWFGEHKRWIYFRRKFSLLCVFERGEVARKSYRNCAEYIPNLSVFNKRDFCWNFRLGYAKKNRDINATDLQDASIAKKLFNWNLCECILVAKLIFLQ